MKKQNFEGVVFKLFKFFWVISACLCYCAAAAGSWWSFLFAFTAGCCCLPSLLVPGYWQFIVRSWLLAVSYCWLFLDTVGSNICFLLLINSDAAGCCCCCDAAAVAVMLVLLLAAATVAMLLRCCCCNAGVAALLLLRCCCCPAATALLLLLLCCCCCCCAVAAAALLRLCWKLDSQNFQNFPPDPFNKILKLTPTEIQNFIQNVHA